MMCAAGYLRVAADIGAGSVKLCAARFDGTRIALAGARVFPNTPVRIGASLRIDLRCILGGIAEGVRALEAVSGRCSSLGIDTFGNGYGILDERGTLTGLPFHYRDGRTAGVLGKMASLIPERELYARTGIYPVESRVLMQLFTEMSTETRTMPEGCTFLPLPDLLRYVIAGSSTAPPVASLAAERTIASVSCLLEVGGRDWNLGLFEDLGIPCSMFPVLTDMGISENALAHDGGSEVAIQLAIPDEANAPGGSEVIPFPHLAKVIQVISHDTESALLAIPESLDGAVFACLGTSIVFGMRTAVPVVNDAGFEYRFKNVRGAFGENSLCKDFPGFWIVNRCLDSWNAAGERLTMADAENLARAGTGMRFLLDLSDSAFRCDEVDMIRTIHAYCLRTGRIAPESKADLLRSVYESMAVQIRWSLECLKEITGTHDRKRLVALNGGSNSPLLLQMLADATGLEVIAGSAIASSLGNIIAQLLADGEIAGERQARELVAASVEARRFTPGPRAPWDDALGRMQFRSDMNH